MAKCDRKCFECNYADCIDNTVTAMDLLDIIDFEKAAGVYQPEDFKWFGVELEFFVRRDRRRERAAERMQKLRNVI